MKNIAVVTGASSGMGREFAKTVREHYKVDEIWGLALDKEGLDELEGEVDVPVVKIPCDLTDAESLEKYKKLLEEEKPNIMVLVNAAGFGIFDSVKNTDPVKAVGMVKLNCVALVDITVSSLPYMDKGSKIMNFSSMAAFQPIPYIDIYASTKAFVLSFSRSLNQELKKDGIQVMALTPFWTKTKFFDVAVTKNPVVKKYVCMYEADKVIAKAWRDLDKGKDYSAYGFTTNLQILLSKLLPHKLLMWYWKKQQKLD